MKKNQREIDVIVTNFGFCMGVGQCGKIWDANREMLPWQSTYRGASL